MSDLLIESILNNERELISQLIQDDPELLDDAFEIAFDTEDAELILLLQFESTRRLVDNILLAIENDDIETAEEFLKKAKNIVILRLYVENNKRKIREFFLEIKFKIYDFSLATFAPRLTEEGNKFLKEIDEYFKFLKGEIFNSNLDCSSGVCVIKKINRYNIKIAGRNFRV